MAHPLHRQGPVEGTNERATKVCQRCGRRGRNAFRRLVIGDAVRGWVCSHGETCAARTRLRARRQHREAGGEGHSTLPWIDKPVCVIGTDTAEARLIGQVLEELAGLDVDVLDGSARSLARLTARDYGCVVVSCFTTDGVSFLGDLARRLETMRRRAIPVVVCHTAGVPSPAAADLIQRAGALGVTRPFDAAGLVAAVGRAAAGDPHASPRAVQAGRSDRPEVARTA
jgi:hypothetical protein